MKKLLLLLILILTLQQAHAQYVTIPDSGMVNTFQMFFPNCINGNQLDTTCSSLVSATSVYVSMNAQNLEGIQYFDNLQELIVADDIFPPYIPGSVTNVPSFPSSPYLTNIRLSGTFTSLPPIPSGVTDLFLYGNLSVMPSLPINLHWFYFHNNSQMPLPVLPPNIDFLVWDNNPWDTLPNLPASLLTLYCRWNQLPNLPSLPNGLQYLNCENNLISNVNILPDSLRELYCKNNLISIFPSILPDSLFYIDCSNNLLGTLDSLPPVLSTLDCNSNNLTHLPDLPIKLSILNCGLNQLTQIPNLPYQLHSLSCNNNLLTFLPALPIQLGGLNCNNNLLTFLPTLPNQLVSLDCSHNQITTLPFLSGTIYYLVCNNNNLTSLSNLSDSLFTLDIKNNPSLNCLPAIKKVKDFSWANTGITCLPDYGQITNPNPPISALPLCDIFNTNGCQFFWNISGKIYNDANGNCINDLSESKTPNLKLKLYQDSILIQETFSNEDGNFSFNTDTGSFTFTVDTTDLPFYISCPVSGFNSCYVPSNDSVVMDKNFGVICKPGFDVGVNTIVIDSGRFRPGNFARIHFYAGEMTNKYGLHCASGVNGMVQVVMSGNATYIGPAVNALTPVITGDTLNYTIADFGNVNFYSDFGVVMQTDTTAQAGDQICFDVSVSPTNGDNVAANNFLTHCFTVVNSYDPNEKTVYPSQIIDDKNGKLTYTIQFQNTGTATAQHIYIMDTLDANLDVSSFELLAYSVQPVVQIIGNVARFNFPNINLPDSNSNEPGSHGFVQFRIKLKDGLSLHTSIANTSFIYFDFNSPVQTNTVVDTLLDCNLVVNAFNISQTSFCKDDTLFANVSLNDDAIVNWYLDNVLIASDSIISIPNITLGNHTLETEVITYYCTKEISTSIFVNDLPAINLGNDTAVCNTFLLDAGAGFVNYLWSNGATTQSIAANIGLLYSVTITDANGCSNDDVIDITINPLPTISFNAFTQDTICITHGIQTINSGNPSGGNFTGVGVSGNLFDPTVAGVGLHYITYEYTDTNDCSNSAIDSVLVDLCLGVPSAYMNDEIKVYPNPAVNSITIEWFAGTQTMDKLVVEIYDLTGRKLKTLSLSPSHRGVGEADISDLAIGNYVIKIFEGENLKTIQRLVKMKE